MTPTAHARSSANKMARTKAQLKNRYCTNCRQFRAQGLEASKKQLLSSTFVWLHEHWVEKETQQLLLCSFFILIVQLQSFYSNVILNQNTYYAGSVFYLLGFDRKVSVRATPNLPMQQRVSTC